MKPLLILFRIIIVGLLWSVFFMESIRVIMLRNWHFDILNMDHWQLAWNLWQNSWVISAPKEWAFVLIIVSFIPLWFTGWIALSLISWSSLAWFILSLPWKLFKNFFYKPVKIITTNTGVTPIKKKPSYKEIRPRAIRTIAPISEKNDLSPAPISIPTVSPILNMSPAPQPHSANLISDVQPNREASQTTPKNFEHALFKFDDDVDDLDFDIDAFVVDNKNNRKKEDMRKENSSEYSEKAFENDSNNRDVNRNGNRRDNRRDERREERRDTRKEDRRNNDKKSERSVSKSEDRNDMRTKDRRDDDFNAEKSYASQPRKERTTQVSTRAANGSCLDIIKQKGYEVINRVSIKNTLIDYIGISDNKICLCMLDREPGDWLADEERFNDEEPLWFSESSHRISPVRKIDLAKQALLDKLDLAEMDFSVEAYVIIQIGNIINAEDMFDIWESLDINVTRIDRGTPKEIKLFARTLQDADKKIPPSKLDKVMKLIHSMS